jgi:hypothetical protein
MTTTTTPRDFGAFLAMRERQQERQTTIEAAKRRLLLRCSYSRLDELLDLFAEMSYPDWLAVCGWSWTMCDNIGRARLLLRQLLPARGPVAPLMDVEGCLAWDALPERVTVYRGCGPVNMLGASWSLSRDVAARFPFLSRYRQAQPLLVTATVRRDRVLAVKLQRNEAEVITFDARRVAVEPLHHPPEPEAS